ncbi:bifunctional acetate--CoA ligase family protein/GNAT family N-acetyltransferase [Rhodovastum atsumiense]|uniref:Bifunctional acetate--CoA ligase family protein/GNAT family N-acetyltransferase n=1 Tax=Rhodovastum atsumiense TaxID=504468 RepID=A0A5M6IPM8_9PROT|nr:GNAT family N-acetyltransferase [Rhodovastum atsumiense]KAA5610232.1 bifunctional acetate--CoA ligase family protein/GNAT family N-acetyltransferase [Rhodovastum atsumiense]
MVLLRPGSGRFRSEALFRPKSVAVLGAGTELGAIVMANMLAAGFKGAILPVAPGQHAISGVLAYDGIDALPVAPDLAVLCDGAMPLDATFAALAKRGTHAGVVVGDTGSLRDAALTHNVRALGPGSFGIVVPEIGLNASCSHLQPRPGRIALVSQSAALCRSVLDWAEPNGVGFSHIIGIGGNTDLGFGVVLDWLARDPGTGAILLDIRHIKDRRAFISAARAAARLRPMVAIRPGGRMQDPSGEADAALVAALRRCGILAVPNMDDFLAAAETLTRARPARGEALAVVTNAHGPAQLAADAALEFGLKLAELTPETRNTITQALPGAFRPGGTSVTDSGSPGADIVYAAPGNPTKLAEAASLLAGAREVGGVLVVHAPTGAQDEAAIQGIAAAAAKVKVPMVVCAMGETTGGVHRRRLADAGVPVFPAPEQAVRGFLHLVQDRRNRAAARELPPRTVLRIAPDQAEVRRAFRRARAADRLMLTQDEAMVVLGAYGIPVVPSRPAMGAEDAAYAATMLGFPVVLKRRRADRPDPNAKSGLVLDLRDADQVRTAATMLERRGEPGPESENTGFVVQRQVGRARELLMRVSEDKTFGPTLVFGQGGTAAQFLRDVAIDLPPLNLPLAHALIARTRVAATLGPLHDQPAANQEAVADALVRLSQLVVDFPEIAEIDVNPMFADADGVLVADAWIRLRADAEAPGRLAIPPYPAELSTIYDARGEMLTVRPIRPEDAAAHGEFFKRLSPEDVRYRFFSALRELSAEQVSRLTQIDYEREIAFVAVREETGETVGVARLVREMNGSDGEFAVVVEPSMKGRGLARYLMNQLIAWGRTQGLTDVVGQVLSDNAPMIAFVRHIGFSVRRVPGEEDIVEARLALVPEPVAAASD